MKYDIKPLKLARGIWLGALGDEWELYTERPRGWNGRPCCHSFAEALNYAVLVLGDVEAVELALLGRLWDERSAGIDRFDDSAVRKLIKRAKELWTFK